MQRRRVDTSVCECTTSGMFGAGFYLAEVFSKSNQYITSGGGADDCSTGTNALSSFWSMQENMQGSGLANDFLQQMAEPDPGLTPRGQVSFLSYVVPGRLRWLRLPCGRGGVGRHRKSPFMYGGLEG